MDGIKDNIIVRRERADDFANIRDVVKSAFSMADYSDGNEHVLVGRLRATPEYIPELSLVAVKDNDIIGYIMMTRLRIGDAEALALAPLAVRPDYQNMGIGTLLVERAHDISRIMGYKCSVVLGSPLYYSRFGYLTASRFGIVAPFDVPEDYYMVCPLNGCMEMPSGVVRYSDAFITC